MFDDAEELAQSPTKSTSETVSSSASIGIGIGGAATDAVAETQTSHRSANSDIMPILQQVQDTRIDSMMRLSA